MVSDCETPVLELCGVWNHYFVAITPRFTVTRSGSSCLGPIYMPNKCLKITSILSEKLLEAITIYKALLLLLT